MPLPPPALDTTVLVTGASAGIGTELARELARRGYGVTLVARRRERLDALADELRRRHDVRAAVRACDLGDAAARARLVAELLAGDRDVVGVCNNAGFGTVGRFAELDLSREAECVRVNVEALHELTGSFLAPMVAQGTGAILNVASTAAFQPLPGFATYAATKAFVVSFSEAVHAELAGTGVSVTVLCPGVTRTEFGAVSGAAESDQRIPRLAFMDPVDVARQAIDAMVAGRRSVVPGMVNKALSTAGRHVPRTLLLPVVRRAHVDR